MGRGSWQTLNSITVSLSPHAPIWVICSQHYGPILVPLLNPTPESLNPEPEPLNPKPIPGHVKCRNIACNQKMSIILRTTHLSYLITQKPTFRGPPCSTQVNPDPKHASPNPKPQPPEKIPNPKLQTPKP